MKKRNGLLVVLTCTFFLLLTATVYASFEENITEKKITAKKITAVYNNNNGVVVTEDNATFNDKNQVVDYKVVIENKEDYDVKISNINLSTPTEKFLNFEVTGTEGILESNSTKEIIVSFETTGIKGWGRNFNDTLTANISFEKVAKQEEVIPPTEEIPKEEEQPKEEEIPKEEEQPKEEEIPKEEEQPKEEETPKEEEQPKSEETPEEEEKTKEENEIGTKPIAPLKNTEELIAKAEKIEVASITNDTIEFKENFEIEPGNKIAVWIYSEPIFLGYFDVIEENGIKKIKGLEAAIAKVNIDSGEHNIALVLDEKTLGYINISITNHKDIVIEDIYKEEIVENPNTSDNKLLTLLIISTTLTGLSIVVVSKNNVAKYMIFAIVLGGTLIPTKAEESIELPLTFNISFKSQNVMEPNGCRIDYNTYELAGCEIYDMAANKIKNIYINNEIKKINGTILYQYDATEEKNGRVMMYLVLNSENLGYADLYFQADGIIYPNEDASFSFAGMTELDSIENLEGFDTSNVTNMKGLFYKTGYNNPNFSLDLSSFKTSNVTEMSYMFYQTGYNSKSFELDISNFDTSNVVYMSSTFYQTGYNSPNFTINLGAFDTSNVVYTRNMFYETGYNSTKLNINITLKNPNTKYYENMFTGVATKGKSRILVDYTKETEDLANKMMLTKSLDSYVEKATNINDISIGDEIVIRNEKFNVISQTEDTITMLAQYNLGTDYKQSQEKNYVKFSNDNYWSYSPGPKEIDIQQKSTNPGIYINKYVEYLKEIIVDENIYGDLITLEQLRNLGCTMPANYASTSLGNSTCANSKYKHWIANGQQWWTRSAVSDKNYDVWMVYGAGVLNNLYCYYLHGVRPVITIPKANFN